MEIENKIRAYVEENFVRSAGGGSITNDDSLLESGILDSAGIFQLVVFLEEAFGVVIADEDIIVDNFENVTCIAKFVNSKVA